MATLREYFDGEFGHMLQYSAVSEFTVNRATEKVYYSFDENTYFLGFFIAEQDATPDFLHILLAQADNSRSRLTTIVEVVTDPAPATYPTTQVSNADLFFTGRIFMYVDALLDEATKQSLVAQGSSRGWLVQIRDRKYAEWMSQHENLLGFISHDSRDKDDFVRPLAERLRSALCPVWYDEFSLRPGDSLVESIGAGLRESKRCVVVLSHNFMSNTGWGKAEFEAIMNRQFAAGGGVLIPIWHDVTRDEVAAYSPFVVGTVAINTNVGKDKVFDQLRSRLLAD